MISELLHQLSRLLVWFVVVAPWEQALRVRLGKRVQLLGAGTYFAIPFFDRIYRQSIRRRLATIPPQALTTRDRHSITVGGAVGYVIDDLRRLYDTLHDADGTIDASVSAMISEYVATHDLTECTPLSIEECVRGQLDLSQYGLGSQEFYVTNFVACRTYRLINGEIRSWSYGSKLNTENADVGPARL